jgi:hypothetical protein
MASVTLNPVPIMQSPNSNQNNLSKHVFPPFTQHPPSVCLITIHLAMLPGCANNLITCIRNLKTKPSPKSYCDEATYGNHGTDLSTMWHKHNQHCLFFTGEGGFTVTDCMTSRAVQYSVLRTSSIFK